MPDQIKHNQPNWLSLRNKLPECLASPRWCRHILHLPGTRGRTGTAKEYTKDQQVPVCIATHSQAPPQKMDLPSCPYQPRCRCQPYACVHVQVPNWGQKTSASGTCQMYYDSVHKQHNPKPWKYPSVCEIPWQTHTEAHLQGDKPKR